MAYFLRDDECDVPHELQFTRYEKSAERQILQIREDFYNIEVELCRPTDYLPTPGADTLYSMLHAGGQGGGITAAIANEGWHYLERHGIQRFILDSGAGEDIIPAENESLNALLRETQRGVKLETCNGTVRSVKVVDLLIKALGIGITAYALPKSPALLPVGKRALEDGFTHIWVGGHEPLLIKPDGSAAIPMQLRNKCPYLYEAVETIYLPCGDDLYEKHGICMRYGCLCI